METLKTCSKCREAKPHSEFYKHPKAADGLQSQCKLCQRKPPKSRQGPKPFYVPDTKVCSYCKAEKPSEEFYHRWSAKDGLTSRCKGCFKLNSKRRDEPLSPTKVCTKCKVEYPRTVEFFSKHPQTIDRLGSWCRACCGKINGPRAKANYAKKRRLRDELPKSAQTLSALMRWLSIFKSLSSCHYCGEDMPECLDFHHRDPADKDFTISQAAAVTGITRERLKAEILKCDIVCATCHRKIHAGKSPKVRKYRLNTEDAIRKRFDEVDGLMLQVAAAVRLKMRSTL